MNQKFIQRVLATLERIATSGTSRELKRVPILKKILAEAQELESIRASKVKGAQLRPPWAPPREPFAGRLGLFGGKPKAPPAKAINPQRTLTSFRDRTTAIAAENARWLQDQKVLKELSETQRPSSSLLRGKEAAEFRKVARFIKRLEEAPVRLDKTIANSRAQLKGLSQKAGGVDPGQDALFLPDAGGLKEKKAQLLSGLDVGKLRPETLEKLVSSDAILKLPLSTRKKLLSTVKSPSSVLNESQEPAKNLGALYKAAENDVFKQDLSKTPPAFIEKALRQDNAKRFRGEWPVKVPEPENPSVPYGEMLREKRLAAAARFEAKGETIKAGFVRRSLRQDDLLEAMAGPKGEAVVPERPWKGGTNRNRVANVLGPHSNTVNAVDHRVKRLDQALQEAVREGVPTGEAAEDAAEVLFRFASGQEDARRVETLGKMTMAELSGKAPLLSALLAKRMREVGIAKGDQQVRSFLRNAGRGDPGQVNVLQLVRALATTKGRGEQPKMLKGVLVKPGGGLPLYKYADDRNLNAPGLEALREIARQKRVEKGL